MANRLTMRFTTAQEGKYFSLDIDNIKEDEKGEPAITQDQISTLMDLIVAKKIFISKNGSPVGKKDAKIVTTATKQFEMK
ncbi:DUF2922 domain-containing protein [Clostridium sp. JN-1]|uniref:DUF2922 domain-containing protein n=1 Tax=Clostridium sp. JN-1 TaxID=2483110 RepID=UPI000F0BD95A|nr:DUF2922 domain-containing protein [Clostridium sp. JN-1]